MVIMLLGCNATIQKPEDKYEHATMKMEYDWMCGYEMDTNLGGIFNYVGQSFLKVGMRVTFIADDDTIAHILPAYDGGLFPNNDYLLRTYAKSHLNHGWLWHLLYVDKFAGNTNGLNYGGMSVSPNNGYNVPATPANERYSMLFWQDIINAYPDYESPKKAGVYITTHELGHQRAGLSDYQVKPEYHNGLFDINGDFVVDCVMNYFTGNYSLNPQFCYDIPADSDTTNSCKDIFETNFGNF